MADEQLRARIAQVLRDLLKLPEETPVEGLSRANCANWDSIAQLMLVTILEDAFEIEFTTDDYAGMVAFEGVAQTVRAKLG